MKDNITLRLTREINLINDKICQISIGLVYITSIILEFQHKNSNKVMSTVEQC